ncbi:MAG: hypothetical protein ACI89L_000420 [Phycisphaerales bacterium]|jgi:hypothetical protein
MQNPTATIPNSATHARVMYLAVLEGWAMDCLHLRANGIDVPSARRGSLAGPTRAHRARRHENCLPDLRPVSPRWQAA